MIKEDYVSLHIAKLLKEKGFDEECVGYYVDDNPNEIFHSYCGETNSTWESRCCSCPTHQMTLKWLREVHHIHFDIHPRLILEQWSGYDITAYSFDEDGFYKKQIVIKGLMDDTPYEQAVEAAIKYCLENLI